MRQHAVITANYDYEREHNRRCGISLGCCLPWSARTFDVDGMEVGVLVLIAGRMFIRAWESLIRLGEVR